LRSRFFETKNFDQAKLVHSAAKLGLCFSEQKIGDSNRIDVAYLD
jgi:hypothetical protein